MKDEPLVSIIVPVYNVEDYVLRCLDSLVKQSYKNLELIVVDDGATDESGKKCDTFSKQDKRVKVYHKKNGGLSDARNFGIRKAKGEVIALVDSDDYVHENYVLKMIDTMRQYNAEIVVCGYDKQLPKPGVLTGMEAAERLLVNQDNTDVVAWNKLYKKQLFYDVLYPVGEKHEDSLTTYRILAKAKKVVYIAESLYYYAEREGSIMNVEKIEERLKVREKAAYEAIIFFGDKKDLKDAAKVSLLLAKYAFIDAALRGEIGKNYYRPNLNWIKEHRSEYVHNRKMTKRLRFYNSLIKIGLYKAFRKIL